MLRKNFLIVLILSSTILAQGKKYLVRVDNSFGIYYEDEKFFLRLSDDKGIHSATWSPDGNYIAYGLTYDYESTKLFIIDEAGKKFGEISIQPLKDKNFEDDNVRYIKHIEWRDDNIIITDSNVGPHGGLVDIWQIDSSFNYKHLKRADIIECSRPSVSPKLDFMACGWRYDESDKNEYTYGIAIHNLNKKWFPEDKNFFDEEPASVEIGKDKIREVKWLSENEILIVLDKKKAFYVYKIKEDKLEKIDSMPKEVKIKEFPEVLEIKIGNKKHKLYGFPGTHNIFDSHQ